MIRAFFVVALASAAASAPALAQSWQHWGYESQPGGEPPMAYHTPYMPVPPGWQQEAPPPQMDNFYRGLPSAQPGLRIGPPSLNDDDDDDDN